MIVGEDVWMCEHVIRGFSPLIFRPSLCLNFPSSTPPPPHPPAQVLAHGRGPTSSLFPLPHSSPPNTHAGVGTWPGANFVIVPTGQGGEDDKIYLKFGDRRKIAAELKVCVCGGGCGSKEMRGGTELEVGRGCRKDRARS